MLAQGSQNVQRMVKGELTYKYKCLCLQRDGPDVDSVAIVSHISMADGFPSSLAAKRTIVAQLLKKAMEDC